MDALEDMIYQLLAEARDIRESDPRKAQGIDHAVSEISKLLGW